MKIWEYRIRRAQFRNHSKLRSLFYPLGKGARTYVLLHKNFAKDYSHNSLKYLTHLLLDWRKFSLRKNNRQIILFYQRKVVILQKIYKDK